MNKNAIILNEITRKVGDIVSKINEWLEKDKLILLEGWSRDGLTYEQIAKNMGIGLTTLKEWRQKEPTIQSTLKKGREVVDFEVENALLKKALGYNVPIQKAMKIKDVEYENGKKIKEIERIEYYKEEMHIPADTTAQIFWLKNRKAKDWKDRVETPIDPNKLDKVSELLNKIEEEAQK